MTALPKKKRAKVQAEPKRQLLTTSRLKTWRRCQREERNRYLLGIVALTEKDALRFGTLWHHGMEAWWLQMNPFLRLQDAQLAVAEHAPEDFDPFVMAMLMELLRGYTFRWAKEPLVALAVEREFRAPLKNPLTGEASATWELAGKIDVIVRDDRTIFIMEHKTTSEDITPGSSYWAQLRADTQASMYFRGAEALGYAVDECVYDVVAKVQLRPLKATPEENRKYKANGELYANQRAEDESIEDFAARVRDEIAANPDRYFQRQPVVRLETDLIEHDVDTWTYAQQMDAARAADQAPRNTDACKRYGSFCSYHSVCCGAGDLNDPTQFGKLEFAHSELTKEGGK